MSPNEHKPITEAEKIEMRDRVNARIAHWCSFAALVIILIDFAAFVIGTIGSGRSLASCSRSRFSLSPCSIIPSDPTRKNSYREPSFR